MVTKKTQITLLLITILLGNGCSFMRMQQEHDKRQLVKSLENIIPKIATDSLFSDDYDGMVWLIYSRNVSAEQHLMLNDRKRILAPIIQFEDTIGKPTGLAFIEYNYYYDEILYFDPPPYPWDDSTKTMVDKNTRNKIIESKNICRDIILRHIPNSYFIGASWRKGNKIWNNYNENCYPTNFYLNFYYKRKLYQLIYVDNEVQNDLMNDQEYRLISKNWFLRRYILR